jgi:hypothetical protein
MTTVLILPQKEREWSKTRASPVDAQSYSSCRSHYMWMRMLPHAVAVNTPGRQEPACCSSRNAVLMSIYGCPCRCQEHFRCVTKHASACCRCERCDCHTNMYATVVQQGHQWVYIVMLALAKCCWLHHWRKKDLAPHATAHPVLGC